MLWLMAWTARAAIWPRQYMRVLGRVQHIMSSYNSVTAMCAAKNDKQSLAFCGQVARGARR
jgi:hypothetical protein